MRKTLPIVRVAAIAATLLMVASPPTSAHLGEPSIQGLRFPPSRAEAPWLIVDNVGLLARGADGWSWLCDEAITPTPGLNDLAPIGADGRRWLAATRAGLFRTDDGGCGFAPIEVFADDVIGHVVPHPLNADEALITTQTIAVGGDGEPTTNDIYRTVDGGQSWAPAGLALTGRVRAILRAVADPQVVYAIHSDGALRSDDGGQSFAPIALADTDDAAGADIELLATAPDDPRVVYSAFARFPDSDLLRSDDGGQSWRSIARFPDVPSAMIIDPESGHMLIAMPFEGLMRSDDGGESWQPMPLPLPGAWFDCLTWRDGVAWACVRRGAPYSVAHSDDFGQTWQGEFAADYRDIAGPWSCPADSPTAATCAEACDRSREDCSGEAPDGGPDDMGPDATGPADMGPPTGGEISPTPSGDCQLGPGAPGSSPLALGLLMLLGLAAIRR